MKAEEIKMLLEAFDASSVAEMELETDGERLSLKKNAACVQGVIPAAVPAGIESAASAAVPVTATAVENAMQAIAVSQPVENAPADQTEATAAGEAVGAPLAGIFYRAASPEAEPYVSVGQKVKKGETIGLIEAMKIINEIPAPCDGVVVEIAAENGAFVQYDETLMRIE